MRCIIPGSNIKVFARAVHSVAKIGEDLYLDPQPDGLALRAMNSSRSAFVSYLFRPNFFTAFEDKTEDDIEQIGSANLNTSQNPSKCRVSMKAILMVFRSISNLEKTVESCLLQVLSAEEKVRIELQCKYSVIKLYSFPFIECETLKATFETANNANSFTCSARVLTEVALNFMKNQEEVTMSASPDQFVMSNFVDLPDEKGAASSAVRTELTMQPGEFDSFAVRISSTVTFCLKELRAVMAFADAFSLPLEANYDEGGSPIVFKIRSPDMVDAALVMATLATDPAENPPATATSNRDKTIPTEDILAEEAAHDDDNELVFDRSQKPDSSPPSKRARFLFKRCFEATFNPANIPGHDHILAPDSDDENS